MTPPPEKPLPSLDTLQAELDSAHAPEPEKTGSPYVPPQGLGMAMRIGVELVASVAAGGALGYFLDRWLGTSPWLFLLGFRLGCAAAFRNLQRAALQLDKAEESGTNTRA